MAGRYADLSTEELDRLIELEERRLGRERGAAKRRRQRCARDILDCHLHRSCLCSGQLCPRLATHC